MAHLFVIYDITIFLYLYNPPKILSHCNTGAKYYELERYLLSNNNHVTNVYIYVQVLTLLCGAMCEHIPVQKAEPPPPPPHPYTFAYTCLLYTSRCV